MELGTLIDRFCELRTAKRALEEQIKPLNTEMAELERVILNSMDTQGLPKASGKKASASRAETIIGMVQDWEPFYSWITENNALYMLEKRLSQAAFREAIRMTDDGTIPGTSTFNKISLNLRTL